ncbi:tRNA uridine-5-carboxymethylaminomethyl(34) synthesis GTPase MnmE [Chelativorans sp. AA-79]|uniref:tRNA uridine-5-carboxymethylaminomethyl(34) synthesis GTPase MnmE n=1 Tax=Chelativorans sp. AA-79 TaxID=3028735 RepID=UPI0023F94CE3|nr:tRNA uridine-5-carboxymethylaminomethyl(34) synthesis GTPase MnmE [Chelativorans sp. AA-79]WEX11755.1 tRNA uridine-5-carboxymethylaminomethyl(34) synthesis GTPase MnmE [Chelativorans sp. AA-79]
MPVRDTIFALSSGALPSGVAVIRISGPATRNVLERVAGSAPKARYARLTEIRDSGGAILDQGLVLYFPGPASFTGEDCAELHLHGGRAVVAAVLNLLGSLRSLRQAEAGEFTKRAFLNGKVDLTGAEALSDLIGAETEAQRRFALSNGSGAHRRLYMDWRQRLIRARAMIEAELDFADEADVPGSVGDTVWGDIHLLRGELAEHKATYRTAEIIRKGLVVVILGAPNAGKSSLLNALARREVAIVTEEPGTTRDILEVSLDLHGMKVILADTAGIREASGRIEAIGIERTFERARDADLLLLLEDITSPAEFGGIPDKLALRVGNKMDLAGTWDEKRYDCVISAKTGDGLDGLVGLLRSVSTGYHSQAGETLPFRARHVVLLQEAIEALDEAIAGEAAGLELRAEHLRLAGDALGRIFGEIGTEDLLDTIFSTFCIGK